MLASKRNFELSTSPLEVVVPAPAINLLPESRKWFLVWLNAGLAAIHLGLALVTVLVGNPGLAAPLYLVSPSITVVNTTVTVAPGAPEALGPLYLTWLVASFFAVTAFAHALPVASLAYREKVYFYGLSRGVSANRWVEYFVSASIMLFIIHYMSGETELKLLLGPTALMAATMTFGLLSELINKPTSELAWPELALWERWSAQIAGTFTYLAAWGLVVLPALPSLEQAPSFVTVIVGAQVALFSTFWAVPIAQLLSTPAMYTWGEVAYMTLSLASKATLGGLVLANVLWRDTFEEVYA